MITIDERKDNFGLSRNIIGGVTEVLAKYGRVIVVEDDLVCSPAFLRYMNDGLQVYVNEDSVASIHGWVYPIDHLGSETFFLLGADCWGWATWSRAWKFFDEDGAALLSRLETQGVVSQFDRDGAFSFKEMLRDQIAGANDSWAIRWHASAFLANMYTLYPGRSLVQNIGNDASGTHCNRSSTFDVNLQTQRVIVDWQPVVENQFAGKAIADFAKSVPLPHL